MTRSDHTGANGAGAGAAASEVLAAENDHLKVQVAVLRAVEQRFRATLYGIADAVIVADVTGRVQQLNRAAETLTGWREAEALGKAARDVFRIVNEETRAEVESPIARVVRDGAVAGLANHTLLIARDGTERSIADSAAPIRDETGRVTGVVLVFRDVSEERRHERERDRLSNALHERIKELDCLQQLGRIIEEEPASIERILERAVRLLPSAVRFPDSAAARVVWGERAFLTDKWSDSPWRLGACLRIGGNDSGVVEISYLEEHPPAHEGPFLKEERMLIDAIAERIGHVIDRLEAAGAVRRTEEALRENRRLMQDVLDNSSSLIYIVDADGRFLLSNRALDKVLGVQRGAPVGQTREGLLPRDIADQHRRNDLQVMRDGRPIVFEEESVEPDGRHVYSTAKFPLFDSQGRIYAIGGMSTDITERKLAEEKLRSALNEVKRSNSELEQFAYVASHDLQEPLRKVASFTQLLAERYGDKLDADAKEFIAYAVDGAHRMQVLIMDLLAFSRVSTGAKPFAPVHCELPFEHAVANLELAIRESGAEVTHDPLPTVKGDAVQLAQLFQNLIGNAIKFHGTEPPRVHVSAAMRENEWIFRVRDNGIGIDPQYFDRIFVIFQRLHSRTEYQGTGIGLAISKKVVERHGGRIWVESEPGKGSSFFFSMPPG